MDRLLHVSVSIIIATQPSRKEYLAKCLESVKKEHHSEIRVIEEGNVSEARNLGALTANGEFLVFLDDDVELREGCLDELLKPFSDPKVGLVGGVNISFPDIGLRERIASSIFASSLAMARSASRYTHRGDIRETDESELLSCFMAIRRDAFMDVKGFPIDQVPCEENVLINRVQEKGWKTVYNPFAVVYHRRPRIFLEHWRTIYHYGRGRGLMLRRKRGSMKMIWMPNIEWLLYPFVLLGHYASYLLGFLRGYFG